jgi:hypothetical protein
MNSPKIMTESRDEGAIFYIQKNFIDIKNKIDQSSEVELFDCFFPENKFNIYNKYENKNFDDQNNDTNLIKFNDFLGDSEDSLEISDILSHLGSLNQHAGKLNYYEKKLAYNNDYCNSHKAYEPEISNDSENIEILNILNRHPKTAKSIPCRGVFHGSEVNNIINFTSNSNQNQNFNSNTNCHDIIRPLAVKKISLNGRVLKSMDSTNASETISPEIIPRRPERSSNPIFKNNYNESNINIFDRFHELKL